MSRRNRRGGVNSGNDNNEEEEEVELKVNLSRGSGSGSGRGRGRGRATGRRAAGGPVIGRRRNLSSSSSEDLESESESIARSCLSSEESLKYSSSPETETTSMVLVGCPRCLMYVMLSQADPRCPKCKSTVLLDFLRNDNDNNNNNNNHHHPQQHFS